MGAKPPLDSEIFWFHGVFRPQRVLSPTWKEKKCKPPPKNKFLNTFLTINTMQTGKGGICKLKIDQQLENIFFIISVDHTLIFTLVPLQPLANNNVKTNIVFLVWKVLNLDKFYIVFWRRIAQVTFSEKPQMKIISFWNYKHEYVKHTWSDKVWVL